MTFKSSKRNLLPSFIIWGSIYSTVGGLLSYLYGIQFPYVILVALGGGFLIVLLNWLSASIAQTTVTTSDKLLEIKRAGESKKILWEKIQGIRFFSTDTKSQGAFTLIVGKYAKYLGFYRINTSQGDIDLYPSLDNLDSLLKIIIIKAHLKKHSPTFEQSMLGGVFNIKQTGDFPYWEKENNYQPSDEDFKIAVGGLSKSAIKLFFVLLIAIAILAVLFKLYKENFSVNL